MSLPIVAIVGRPNVGKSSLLNCLVGRRISIVDPRPGVTRDRVAAPLAVSDGYVELVDTGGMGIVDSDDLAADVEAQIAHAIDEASLILFVVDAREGVLALDLHVAQELRKQDRPVILVANKVDVPDMMSLEVAELHGLGFGEPVQISAMHSHGRAELMDAIADRLKDLPPEPLSRPVMKLAVVGKRNAGKSTFINALAGGDRVIVSEKPGTTRDSVDVEVELDGRKFLLIDTAGIRKRSSLAGDVEFYSQHRALRSIRRADVVALLIDASVPVSQVDKGLVGEIDEQFKPVVLVVNKWDLAKARTDGEDYADYLAKMFPSIPYAPISLTTASEGVNLQETIRLAEQLFEQSTTRVPTAQLNEALKTIIESCRPSHKTGTKPPKILYAAQISVAPPTIVLFVNDERSFDLTYQRFLLNQFREHLPFKEVPIRLLLRQRRGREKSEGEKKEKGA